jgi:hypothetical protein
MLYCQLVLFVAHQAMLLSQIQQICGLFSAPGMFLWLLPLEDIWLELRVAKK